MFPALNRDMFIWKFIEKTVNIKRFYNLSIKMIKQQKTFCTTMKKTSVLHLMKPKDKKMQKYWIYVLLIFFSCEKEPINPTPEPPAPIEKRVEWKWNTSLEEYNKELQRNPVLYKDWVILGFASDYQNRNIPSLIAFDKNTGNQVWTYTHPVNNADSLRNVILYNDLIILKYIDRLTCLQVETRNVVWEHSYDQNASSLPPFVVYGQYLYQSEDYYDDLRDYPFNDSVSLMRYHIPTGQQEKLYGERMVKDSGKHPELFPPVVYQDGNRELVIFTRNFLDSGDEHPVDKIAIDTKTKEVVWIDTMYSHLSTAWNTPPFIFENNIIAASDYSLYSWNASSGELVWKTELTGLNKLAGFSFSGPFLHDNRIYAVSNNGKIFCVDAKSGILVWQNVKVGANNNGPARGPCNRPIIVDDILYINTWSDQALVLIDINSGQQLERYRDADYNGGNVVYDEETKTFFVTAQDKLRAFTVKKI
jgi:outer membrane protein assembly factor BamB